MLNQEQSAAAQDIESWIGQSTGNWMFKLAGFAGTGKTFLLAEIISNLDRQFWCCAPTGKAASVLSSKLDGIQVMTVHQLLYQPAGQSMAELEKLLEAQRVEPSPELEERIKEEKARMASKRPGFYLKDDSLVREGDLVIVDEASMVTQKMAEDFERTGAKVLFVGDSGQLPPVGSAPWFNNQRTDAQLESVQRQALDNPIIRLSMDIRSGQVDASQYKSDLCSLLPKSKVDPLAWLEFDQVLTGMNKTRSKINRFFRKQKGFLSPLPVAGDKLICIKNDLKADLPKINGVIFEALEDVTFQKDGPNMCEVIEALYNGSKIEEPFYTYHTHKHYDYTLVEEPREMRFGMMELDYAHAITVHKSQGSEWDSVLVADDGFQDQDFDFRKKWLYTAVTRAKSKLLIVK